MLRIKLIRGTSEDRKLSDFIAVYIFLNSLNSTIQTSFSATGTFLSAFKIISQILLFALLVRSINHMQLQRIKYLFFAELVAVLLCAYSVLIGASFDEMVMWGQGLVLTYVPLGVATFLVSDKRVLHNTLLRMSWVLLIISIVDFFSAKTLYDMHFSYAVLFLLLLHLNEAFSRRKKIYVIASVAEAIMILLHGSRGALICLAVYIILKVLWQQYSIMKKIIVSSLIVLVVAVIVLLWDSYYSSIFNLLSRLGISARSLNLIFNGSFLSYDSGRSSIRKATIELILQHPIQGWGIGGAAKLISLFGERGSFYPHQLFLDYWLSFGGILGSVFCILTIYLVIKALRVKYMERDLLHVFICIGFVPLLFTGTVFAFYYFFLFAGLALSCNRCNTIQEDDTSSLKSYEER
jgi:O-antigen ligase